MNPSFFITIRNPYVSNKQSLFGSILYARA